MHCTVTSQSKLPPAPKDISSDIPKKGIGRAGGESILLFKIVYCCCT